MRTLKVASGLPTILVMVLGPPCQPFGFRSPSIAQEHQTQKSVHDLEQLAGQLREARAHREELEGRLVMEANARNQLALQLTEAGQEGDAWKKKCAALEAEVARLGRAVKTSGTEVCWGVHQRTGCWFCLSCSMVFLPLVPQHATCNMQQRGFRQ